MDYHGPPYRGAAHSSQWGGTALHQHPPHHHHSPAAPAPHGGTTLEGVMSVSRQGSRGSGAWSNLLPQNKNQHFSSLWLTLCIVSSTPLGGSSKHSLSDVTPGISLPVSVIFKSLSLMRGQVLGFFLMGCCAYLLTDRNILTWEVVSYRNGWIVTVGGFVWYHLGRTAALHRLKDECRSLLAMVRKSAPPPFKCGV